MLGKDKHKPKECLHVFLAFWIALYSIDYTFLSTQTAWIPESNFSDIAYLLWNFSFTDKLGYASFSYDFQRYCGEICVTSAQQQSTEV